MIGAPFYMMARLDGVVYDDVDATASLTEEQGLAASFELIDVLARLHAVDYEAVGLGDFGRPGRVPRAPGEAVADAVGEVEDGRDARRSTRSRNGSSASSPPTAATRSCTATTASTTRCSGATTRTRMQAVLDWEMSTLGDPLTDVGMVAVYWTDVGEIMWRNRKPQAHRANAGFPDVDTLLDRYATTSGTDLSDIDFYRAFATYKLAVIAQGGARRVEHTDPERAARVTRHGARSSPSSRWS